MRGATVCVRARVCAAVCSELPAPAGRAIPIYPSAADAGGKSAEHRCRRFHIRGTRLPVRGPLCRGDEGGGVGEGVERRRVRGTTKGGEGGRASKGRARAARFPAPPRNPQASVFLGEPSCQAAHLFDTRRCGSAVRGRLSSFISSLSALLSGSTTEAALKYKDQ